MCVIHIMRCHCDVHESTLFSSYVRGKRSFAQDRRQDVVIRPNLARETRDLLPRRVRPTTIVLHVYVPSDENGQLWIFAEYFTVCMVLYTYVCICYKYMLCTRITKCVYAYLNNQICERVYIGYVRMCVYASEAARKRIIIYPRRCTND